LEPASLLTPDKVCRPRTCGTEILTILA
jgi:hypothetical protein